MGKFFWIQTFYCICGVLFFVQDLFAKVPMGQAMLRAFIWPYAQWPQIKATALKGLAPVLALIN
jgi:hypothetical protein